jgi:hypothetical protein
LSIPSFYRLATLNSENYPDFAVKHIGVMVEHPTLWRVTKTIDGVAFILLALRVLGLI